MTTAPGPASTLVFALAACATAPGPTDGAATTPSVAPAPVAPPRLAQVDFDGDGLADLAFSAVDQPGEQCRVGRQGKVCWQTRGLARMTIVVFLGKDAGAISQTIELATGPDELRMGRAHEVGAVGDLDGDGKTELAVQFADGAGERLLLLRGTAGGLSDPYQAIPLPESSYLSWYGIPPRPAGDLDGDATPDIVVGPAILRGIGGGQLGPPELVTAPLATSPLLHLVPVGDVTGDDLADLVIAHGSGAWLVPSAPSTPPAPIALAVPGFLEASDLDGDGRSELVAATRGADHVRVTTYALASTGATPISSADLPGDDVHGVAMADTDGDGLRDVAIVASRGHIDVPCALECTGPANVHVRHVRLVRQARGGSLALVPSPWATPRQLALSLASEQIAVRALGDIDGDGIEELAEVSGGTWIAHRSRGGVLTIAAQFAKAPRQVEILTSYARFDPGR